MLFPPGSRLAETSWAEDAGLAPRESASETLCRWAVMAFSAKGFVFLSPLLLDQGHHNSGMTPVASETSDSMKTW
jgi:hypothetical protein